MSNRTEPTYEAGLQWGDVWRDHWAKSAQVMRIIDLYRWFECDEEHSWEWWFCDHLERFGYTVGERLYFVINPEEYGNIDAAQRFFLQFDADDNDGFFCLGFADGVLGDNWETA